PERSRSHAPLFQVMLILQNAPMGDLYLEGIRMSRLSIESKTSKFDLTLSITDGKQGLTGVFEYNTDLFEHSTIQRMSGHFLNLLECAIDDADRRLSALPLLSEPEYRQIVAEWNATASEYPRYQSLHHLFQEQARRAPAQIGVV